MADRLHPLTHVVEVALRSIRRQPRDFPAVIEWASPVPFFGRAERARIASVGLNPSGREFCDSSGRPLRGRDRRLATLDSVGLRDWSGAGSAECSAVAQACSDYFGPNAYWRWFNPLESIFNNAGQGTLRDGGACHIDLAPWATQRAWSGLKGAEPDALLECGAATFASLVSSARFEVLLLNGVGVVKGVERATGVRLPAEDAPEWDDSSGRGRRWSVVLDSFGRIELVRPVTVLGWNWNLQSSHITTQTRDSITSWAARAIEEAVTRSPADDTTAVVDSDHWRDRELQEVSWDILQLVQDATGSLGRVVERLEILDPSPDEIRGLSSVLEGHFNRVKSRVSQLDQILQPRQSEPG